MPPKKTKLVESFDPRANWHETVNALRIEANRERWRLSVTMNLPQWRVVASLWRAVAPDMLSHAKLKRLCPLDLVSFDSRLAWAWGVVGSLPELALNVIDDRIPVTSYELVSTFDALKGAALIFPDGSIHEGALNRINIAEEILDARSLASYKRRVVEVRKIDRELKKMQNAEAKGQKP